MRRGIAIAAVGLGLGFAGTAEAVTYEVTKRGDPTPGACTAADCSLREAVIAANDDSSPDRVVLPSRKPYGLEILGTEDQAESGDLDVTDSRLAIVHPGKGRATIDGNGVSGVLEAFVPLTLRKLKIIDGDGGYGGGVRGLARLTLNRVIVSGNTAAFCGGGIHTENGAALVLKRSTVRGNSAGSDGGGISASCFGGSGPVRITNSKVIGNRSDSDGNQIGRGGGIYHQLNESTDQSVVSRTTFANNRTGSGGIGANEGGGIYTDIGRLRIAGSTISGNFAGDFGGGISIDGTEMLAVVNSTVAGNRANANGGGIALDGGEASLNAVTVVRNRGNADGNLSEAGGGLYLSTSDPFTVENSLIALNTLTALSPGPPVENDCSGSDPFQSAGHNLLSTTDIGCDGFDGPGDLVRSNPKIGSLKRNGGPTQTVALKQGSAAVGNAKRSSSPSRDQRGERRDRKPDIGAFER